MKSKCRKKLCWNFSKEHFCKLSDELLTSLCCGPKTSSFTLACVMHLKTYWEYMQTCLWKKDQLVIQLTINSKRDLLFACADTWDHGPANIFPSIFLSHRFQCQEVLIAKNLRQKSQRSSNAMIGKKKTKQQNLCICESCKAVLREKPRQRTDHLIL